VAKLSELMQLFPVFLAYPSSEKLIAPRLKAKTAKNR